MNNAHDTQRLSTNTIWLDGIPRAPRIYQSKHHQLHTHTVWIRCIALYCEPVSDDTF